MVLHDQTVEDTFGSQPFLFIELPYGLELQLESIVGSTFGIPKDQLIQAHAQRECDLSQGYAHAEATLLKIGTNLSTNAVRLTLSVARVGRVGIGRVAANDAAYNTGLTLAQKGILTLAAFGAAGASLYNLLSDDIEEEDEDPGFKLYHGTDIATARMLALGMPISIDAENCNWSASCGGFYMADHVGDAEHLQCSLRAGRGPVVWFSTTLRKTHTQQSWGCRPSARFHQQTAIGRWEMRSCCRLLPFLCLTGFLRREESSLVL